MLQSLWIRVAAGAAFVLLCGYAVVGASAAPDDTPSPEPPGLGVAQDGNEVGSGEPDTDVTEETPIFDRDRDRDRDRLGCEEPDTADCEQDTLRLRTREASEGQPLASLEGMEYGPLEGAPYGPPEGVPYGSPEGAPYGPPEGVPYGPQEGASYGSPEGAPYGPQEGASYGPPEGAPHGPQGSH